jgi:hypothetical protein
LQTGLVQQGMLATLKDNQCPVAGKRQDRSVTSSIGRR